MKKLLIAAAVAGTMVSGVAFADNVTVENGLNLTVPVKGAINSELCSTPSSNLAEVNLGSVNTAAFNEENAVVGHKTFTIPLSGCSTSYTSPSGAKLSSISVKMTDALIENSYTGAADKASGVKVQITNGTSEAPLKGDGDNVSVLLNPSPNEITLGAEFKRDGNSQVVAGAFSGTASLTVFYK